MSCRVLGKWLGSLMLLLAAKEATAAPDSAWCLRVWQSDEGLPDNAVVGIGQTQDGFLWVATQGGLVRFDGIQFREFAPVTAAGTPTGLMRALCVDHQDRLWVAKDLTVLTCTDQGRTTALTTENGLPTGRAKIIVPDRAGSLWVGYGKQVVRIRNGQVRSFAEEDGLPGDSQLASDRRGQLWYAGGGKVGLFRDEKFVPIASVPGVQCIAAGRSGGVWICAGPRLYRCSQEGEVVAVGQLPTNAQGLNPTVVYEDSAGAQWIGTSDSGLFRHDRWGFQSINTSHREILCLMEDREGNLWAGTMGGGLNRIRPGIVELVDASPLSPLAGVRSVCQDTAGTLWVADRTGIVARNQGDGWRALSTNEGWTIQNAATVTADPAGGVWIGTRLNGLHLWRDQLVSSLRRSDGLGGNIMRSLLTSPSGDLWIGTIADGLQRLRSGKLQTLTLPPGCGTVRAMALDGSRTFWAGTASGMVLRVRDDVLVNETQVAAALPQAIRCLCAASDGSLWIGYGGTGVGRLKEGRFTQFRSTQGIYDEYISQIIEDRHGRLWFAGNRGLFCVREGEFDAVAQGRMSHVRSVVFGRDEGLPPLQASWDFWPGAVRTTDGRLCIAMQTGLVVVHPEAIERDPAPPPIVIESVAVDDREVAAYDSNPPAQTPNRPLLFNLRHPAGRLKVPAEHQRVTFNFTAPSFAMPKNVAFKYRLEGLDQDWVEAGARRVAYYTHLPPGNYRFRAAACNSPGIWNESGGLLELTAEPHLWETPWFRAVVAISVSGLLAGGVLLAARRRFRSRLRLLEHQRALERERARIAQDLHDDLGAGLVEISFGSELAQDPTLGADEAREHSREIGLRAREMVTALDEIVWAVNPRHDSVASLATYFCQYAQHFLKATPVRCHLEVARDLPAAPLNAEQRHNLFLAFKEALSNVVRHSGATDLWLTISALAGLLSVTLSDNGRGLDAAGSQAGNGADGLGNMQRRLLELGGHCEVAGSRGQGTTVAFKVPLKTPAKTGPDNSIEVL